MQQPISRALLLYFSLALAVPAAAQATLPYWNVTHQFDGTSTWGLMGTSVASAGDVDGDGYADLIVGAEESNIAAVAAGSAWVYSGATGVVLYAFHGSVSNEHFGASVAGVGDLDLDGMDDFFIGAPFASPNNLSLAGRARVYSGATGAILFEFTGPTIFATLGHSVASAGDVNGDGRNDLIVGAPFADPQGLSTAGSVFVYSGLNGAQLYRFDGAAAGDELGRSAASAGDVNGDGFADIIIGAHAADPFGLSRAGSAFVYSGATGGLLYRFDGTAQGEEFGNAVASAGDVDSDGNADLIIGAHRKSRSTATNAGAASIYSGATGQLIRQYQGYDDYDRLGTSVASAGDMDGDGVDDVMFGAPGAGAGTANEPGQVYLYSGGTGLLLQRFNGLAAHDELGVSVASAGDVDFDGQLDIIAGAPHADPGGVDSGGSAYVLARVAATPGPFHWRYSPANGHWYTVLHNIDWATAAATADQYADVELATVRNLDEQTWIFQTLLEGIGTAYMGLNDAAQEGVYVWRSGEPITWWGTNGYFGVGNVAGYWHFQEPNNLNNEDYCTIGRPGAPPANGEWNDSDGTSLVRAVLEWSPTPRPVLSFAGSCPSSGQVLCTGLTPGGNVAFVYGGTGTTSVLAGGCGTIEIGLLNPQLLLITSANSSGEVSFVSQVPAGACGNIDAIAIDLVACVTSNLLFL